MLRVEWPTAWTSGAAPAELGCGVDHLRFAWVTSSRQSEVRAGGSARPNDDHRWQSSPRPLQGPKCRQRNWGNRLVGWPPTPQARA